MIKGPRRPPVMRAGIGRDPEPRGRVRVGRTITPDAAAPPWSPSQSSVILSLMERPATPILCAVDESPRSRSAARYAARLAASLDARLVLVYVAPRPSVPSRPYATVPERERVQAEFDKAGYEKLVLKPLDADVHPAHVDHVVEFGDPAKAISAVAKAHRAALVVVAPRDRGPLGRALLGSVTASLVQQAPCPVVAVPARAPELAEASNGDARMTP